MNEAQIQLSMYLLQHLLSHAGLFTVHWVHAQRKPGNLVRLVEKRWWKIQYLGDPLDVIRRWSLGQQTVFNARIMPLVQAGCGRDLRLAAPSILPGEQQ